MVSRPFRTCTATRMMGIAGLDGSKWIVGVELDCRLRGRRRWCFNCRRGKGHRIDQSSRKGNSFALSLVKQSRGRLSFCEIRHRAWFYFYLRVARPVHFEKDVRSIPSSREIHLIHLAANPKHPRQYPPRASFSSPNTDLFQNDSLGVGRSSGRGGLVDVTEGTLLVALVRPTVVSSGDTELSSGLQSTRLSGCS